MHVWLFSLMTVMPYPHNRQSPTLLMSGLLQPPLMVKCVQKSRVLILLNVNGTTILNDPVLLYVYA